MGLWPLNSLYESQQYDPVFHAPVFSESVYSSHILHTFKQMHCLSFVLYFIPIDLLTCASLVIPITPQRYFNPDWLYWISPPVLSLSRDKREITNKLRVG